MQSTLKILALLGVAGTLAACGQTPAERAATGAAGGAALAIALDEDVGDAAILGAAAGGIGTCLVYPNASGCY